MTLYQIFDLVAAELLKNAQQTQGEHKKALFEYLRNTMDDNVGFTRSRYCRRPEGPVPNREIGNIEYIVCGCTKPFDIQQVRYTTVHQIREATDLQAQIVWVRPTDDLDDTINYCVETNFEYIAVIEI